MFFFLIKIETKQMCNKYETLCAVAKLQFTDNELGIWGCGIFSIKGPIKKKKRPKKDRPQHLIPECFKCRVTCHCFLSLDEYWENIWGRRSSLDAFLRIFHTPTTISDSEIPYKHKWPCRHCEEEPETSATCISLELLWASACYFFFYVGKVVAVFIASVMHLKETKA